MRKLLVFFSVIAMAAIMAVNFSSCNNEDPIPLPTVQLLADIDPNDGYTVNLTVQATDEETISWDYGDSNISAGGYNHSYTYLASGEYEITVTVTNESGTASDSKSVNIAASIEEMIAGAGDDGKTWVLTQQEADYAGKIGPGIVDNTVALIPGPPVPSGVVAAFGLGDEYNDEFTFFKDGTFKINMKNNQGLAGFLYGSVLDIVVKPSDDILSLPLCAIPAQNIDNGTWELSYDDLIVTAYNEFKDPPVLEDVTFTFPDDDANKVAELKLSTGSYVGFIDQTYPAIPEMGIAQPIDNSVYILKEVGPDVMHIAIGLSGVVDVEGVPVFMYPSLMLHLTLVPKQ